MKNQKIKWVAVVAAVLLLGIAVWYKIPVKKQFTATLCSEEGEQITAAFDVVWHRYLFAPTELRGTIEVDGTTYQSIMDTGFAFSKGGLFEPLKEKLNGTVYKTFILPDITNALDVYKNFIKVNRIDNKPNTGMELLMIRDGATSVYYGPAETAEEAKKIILEMLGTE